MDILLDAMQDSEQISTTSHGKDNALAFVDKTVDKTTLISAQWGSRNKKPVLNKAWSLVDEGVDWICGIDKSKIKIKVSEGPNKARSSAQISPTISQSSLSVLLSVGSAPCELLPFMSTE